MADVATALTEDQPLLLLSLVSSLLSAVEPRRPSPFEVASELDLPSRDELVRIFLDVDLLETSALLAVIAELSGDDITRHRIRREIAERAHALPGWLTDLHRTTVERVVEMVHVLGDGDNLMIGLRLPGGYPLSIVVYIDHNMGTLVKDAFVVPEPLDELIEHMRIAAGGGPDTTWADLAPADARVRLRDAIERGAITFPPCETDSWPACRPLVEWTIGMLPTGGKGYRRPSWGTDRLRKLTDRFFASAYATGLEDADHRSLLESILWFGTDYGPGDPLRWSPVAVEILLVDWIPRKIAADVAYLAKAPDVLRAFIRFCHHERKIRPALTDETLAAVDEYEPKYQQIIAAPRPQGPAALLAAMGALHPDGPWPDSEAQLPGVGEIMLDSLRRAVGGEDALAALDGTPLPDESFDWQPIPGDIHHRVAEVIFRRRGRAETAAGAICWIIGKANDLFSPAMPVKDLMHFFGISQGSVSQRSEAFLRAIGVDPADRFGSIDLGSPDYLTSARRTEIITLRDHYRAMV
ncbi:MAG: DUF6398 domain-containing protein [Actinobacteria bacterium]|nr:DUF6398 domain-containing protein [Actinomycetota bacterium]